MLALLAEAPLRDPNLAYEPKYDGIRAIVEVDAGARADGVRIYSRNGNDKTLQFPEVARALADYGRRLKAGVVLDGEIVALDAAGEPAGFQRLQGRIHLSAEADALRASRLAPVALVAFDILRDGAEDLTSLPLTSRRARLERVFGNTGSPLLRLSEFVPADGRALFSRAAASGWEGLVVKHLQSRYKAGQRTPDWRKLKITREQEFVVGGWTEPRGSRGHLGALLLGVYDAGRLEYVGHTGAGFSGAELERVSKLLKALEVPQSPFRVRPRSNERPHWAEPRLVAQVRFTEWTEDGKLRHPIYLGLRDDVDPSGVSREGRSVAPESKAARRGRGGADEGPGRASGDGKTGTAGNERPKGPGVGRRRARPAGDGHGPANPLVAQLDALQVAGGDGVLRLPDGALNVGNLDKVFWPGLGLTKGDLLRYYAVVAPVLLPVLDDRPLVMKRLPNGVRGKAFYQQRAPDDPPAGVRVETMPGDTEVPSRLIGGSLVTLLYMTQLAAISQDPWFSRVAAPGCPDHVAIDLDPMPGVTFGQVLDVARWVHDELDARGIPGFPKTSGADGLHVYIPLPAGTPYEAALLFAQLVATLVAQKHPRQATVTRSVHARGAKVYVDYLQNVRGKTLAAAYSARGSDYAGVSTPLTWAEVHAGVAREDFTILSVPARLREVGDLWAGLRRSKGVDLRRALERFAK
jgi:bifunctional non-homologous end joining protein LigD